MQHQDLWKSYNTSRSIEDRNKLIVLYQPLVKSTARKISKKLPANVSYEDLVSYGNFGLIEAINRFDIHRGVKFETFAYPRIQGAIYDGIRAMDWVPRTVRSHSKELSEAYTELGSTSRQVQDDDLLDHLGWDEAKLQKVRDSISVTHVSSLDEPIFDSEEASLADAVADMNSMSPSTTMEMAEIHQSLTEALGSLSEKEQIVLALYYQEGLKFSEIGEAFEVSESRICQIHMNAIERIRESMMS